MKFPTNWHNEFDGDGQAFPELEMKLIFCIQINISFPQVDFNTLGIKGFLQSDTIIVVGHD